MNDRSYFCNVNIFKQLEYDHFVIDDHRHKKDLDVNGYFRYIRSMIVSKSENILPDGMSSLSKNTLLLCQI